MAAHPCIPLEMEIFGEQVVIFRSLRLLRAYFADSRLNFEVKLKYPRDFTPRCPLRCTTTSSQGLGGVNAAAVVIILYQRCCFGSD
jgi:hypothetical protein